MIQALENATGWTESQIVRNALQHYLSNANGTGCTAKDIRAMVQAAHEAKLAQAKADDARKNAVHLIKGLTAK